MLSFPCYEVNARFDHGMSGGIVVDESRALCAYLRISSCLQSRRLCCEPRKDLVADVADTNLCGPRRSLS